jgi:predicted nicotinamide N-methyase
MVVPSDSVLSSLLDRYAPFLPAPLSPEISVFQGRSLVEIWEAAEKVAGENLAAPFWAYPWAAGCGLARVVLDNPAFVEGLRVLDLGAGGGVVSIAAKVAGAREVVANDVDPWAMAVMRLAAERQEVDLTYLQEDLTERISAVDAFDVVLCSDMAYEKRMAPRYAALLQRARNRTARVLVADAGRTYFDASGMTMIAEFTLNVPKDLEGVDVRTAKVFSM